jgi:hypothetical protein
MKFHQKSSFKKSAAGKEKLRASSDVLEMREAQMK